MIRLSAVLLGVLISQLITHHPVSGIIREWSEDATSLEKLSCDKRTSAKTSIIAETDFDFGINCAYQIDSYNPNVHQLLLKFNFNLTQPTRQGNSTPFVPKCERDYLEIAGKRFCGTEDSQHLYVPFGQSYGVTSIEIQFVLASRLYETGLARRRYLAVRIEQLEVKPKTCFDKVNGCPESDTRLAPVGCSQYFTKEEGNITSFNYRDGRGSYPSSLNYTICIRHPPGAWALKLEFLDFNLRGRSTGNEVMLRERKYCLDSDSDYLSIPSSIVKPVTADDFLNVKNNRFCGSAIDNMTIISEDTDSSVTFFLMYFESKALPKRKSRSGFLLKYSILYEEDASILYEK